MTAGTLTVQAPRTDDPPVRSEIDETRSTRVSGGSTAGDAPTLSRGPADVPGAEPASSIPRIPGYEIEAELGRGGMGVVYRARQRGLDRVVALKVLHKGSDATDEELARFRGEVEAIASLDHPHIVPVYEVGEDAGLHYFSMKYVPGGNLAQALESYRGRPRKIAELMTAIVSGMSHAHRRGILHRDLKPANILLDENGTPMISDFGLAKRWDSGGHELTRTGQIMGTPAYMAPEQAKGRVRDQTTATDTYSLGAILYELLTSRPPFAGESMMDVLLQVIEQPPVAPSKVVADVDGILEAIALKCLEKDPQDRYATACNLLKDLEGFLRGDDVSVIDGTTARFMRMLLRDSRHVEVMALWARVWVSHAIATTVTFLTVSAALSYGWSLGQCGSLMVPYLISLVYAAWHHRLRHDVPFSPVERQLFQILVGIIACLTMCLGLGWSLHIPFVTWAPFAALMASLSFLAMALVLGGSFYPQALFCFVSAPLFALHPPTAAAVFGVLGGIGIYIPARRFARCSTRPVG